LPELRESLFLAITPHVIASVNEEVAKELRPWSGSPCAGVCK